MSVTHHWTVRDLKEVPLVEGERYEVIGGELHVSKQPHIYHQEACNEIGFVLSAWNKSTRPSRRKRGSPSARSSRFDGAR